MKITFKNTIEDWEEFLGEKNLKVILNIGTWCALIFYLIIFIVAQLIILNLSSSNGELHKFLSIFLIIYIITAVLSVYFVVKNNKKVTVLQIIKNKLILNKDITFEGNKEELLIYTEGIRYEIPLKVFKNIEKENIGSRFILLSLGYDTKFLIPKNVLMNCNIFKEGDE